MLSSTLCSFGQPVRTGENEFGVNVYNVTRLNRYRIDFFTPRMDYNLLRGFIYKRHVNDDALRIGFDYYSAPLKLESNGRSTQSEFYYGQEKLTEFRIGYERNLSNSILQLYFSTDLLITNIQTGGHYATMGCVGGSEGYLHTKTKEIGIASGMGLRYRAGKRFSISAETNISLVYSQYTHVYKDTRVYRSLNSNFNPLRVLALSYRY